MHRSPSWEHVSSCPFLCLRTVPFSIPCGTLKKNSLLPVIPGNRKCADGNSQAERKNTQSCFKRPSATTPVLRVKLIWLLFFLVLETGSECSLDVDDIGAKTFRGIGINSPLKHRDPEMATGVQSDFCSRSCRKRQKYTTICIYVSAAYIHICIYSYVSIPKL